MRHLIVVLGLALHVNRCSLARAMGPFSSSCFVVKLNGSWTILDGSSQFHTISTGERTIKNKKSLFEPLAWEFVHFLYIVNIRYVF